MLIRKSRLRRWEKHNKSVTAKEQSEWVMGVTVKISFNITKRRLKWQVRGEMQKSAALGEFVYYQEGTCWLDTDLISSAENKSWGWRLGPMAEGRPPCFLGSQEMLITVPGECGFSSHWRPLLLQISRHQAHGFNLSPQISEMNIASPGDSFYLGSPRREWNPKSKPISVHLDFERDAPQSHLQASEVGSLQPKRKQWEAKFWNLNKGGFGFEACNCVLGEGGMSEWNADSKMAKVSWFQFLSAEGKHLLMLLCRVRLVYDPRKPRIHLECTPDPGRPRAQLERTPAYHSSLSSPHFRQNYEATCHFYRLNCVSQIRMSKA